MRNILIAIMVMLTACNNRPIDNPYAVNSVEAEQSSIPLNNFVTDFKNKHSDWQKNSILTERINKEFADSLKLFMKSDSFLKGYQLKLESINEFRKGKYAVKLVTEYEDKINVEVIGLIPGTLINHLKEDNKYNVEGRFIKRLSDLEPYYDYGLWNVKPGILFADEQEPKVYTGVSLFEITKMY